MKCCMSTDVGTWTNWLSFESDPDHSPDAGTVNRIAFSHSVCNATRSFITLGKSVLARVAAATRTRRSSDAWFWVVCTATWNFITSGKSHVLVVGACRSKQRRVVLRRRNTIVGGKCAPPSAILVYIHISFNVLVLYSYLYSTRVLFMLCRSRRCDHRLWILAEASKHLSMRHHFRSVLWYVDDT